MSSIGALLLKKQSKKREKRLKGGFETKKKNIFIKIWKKVLTTKNVCDKIVNCIIIAQSALFSTKGTKSAGTDLPKKPWKFKEKSCRGRLKIPERYI